MFTINPLLKEKDFSEAFSVFDNIELLIPERRRFFDWQDNPLDDLSIEDMQENPEAFNSVMRLDQACWILSKSPTMRALLEECPGAAKIKTSIGPIDSAGRYSHQNDSAAVHEDFSVWDMAWIIAHELRHKWHKEQGVFNDEEYLNLREKIHLQRLYEADAAAFHTTVCWELKQLGYDIPWKELLSDNWNTLAAQKFEEQIIADPQSLHDGRASRAAFDAFFITRGRVNYYDRKSCREYSLSEIFGYDEKGSSMPRGILNTFNSMPYINEDGALESRCLYLNNDDLPSPLSAEFRKIRQPEIELMAVYYENGEIRLAP